MDRYLDSLFDPVLSDSGIDMEKTGSLSARMKGGGGIGITGGGGGGGEGESHSAPSRPYPPGIHPGAVPVLPVAGGMMPPIPAMPIPSHHHHHEQHQQQQQQQQQPPQYHQYNRPQHPYQQTSSTTTPATRVAPNPSSTRTPSAAPAADRDADVASHVTGVPSLPGGPSLPATTVVPGLPVMTGVPGSEQAVLTQQQQAIINQQAIILVCHILPLNINSTVGVFVCVTGK
ncbi:hypothetical protein PAMP_009443 [Pampus punctatissimus]